MNNTDTIFDDVKLLKAATYYGAKQAEGKSRFISDCLIIGVDISPKEDGSLVVMRRNGDDIYVVSQFRNDEALELYNKLIGVK